MADGEGILNDELIAFLHSGCGLIVGTVAADGAPLASRGWGLEVTAADRSARLLLASDDAVLGSNIEAPARLAVTCASVLTLRSVQLKGAVVSVESVTDTDRERSTRYCDDFFADVKAADRIERTSMERLVPLDLVACRFVIDEMFDQTPGPAAGARLGGG